MASSVRHRAILAAVGASALVLAGVVILASGAVSELPAGAHEASRERVGEVEVVRFEASREATDTWLQAMGLVSASEQGRWTVVDLETHGELYEASTGACDQLVFVFGDRADPGVHGESHRGCGDAARAELHALRRRYFAAASALPPGWNHAVGASTCRTWDRDRVRIDYEFDEAYRLVRERSWRPVPDTGEVWEWSQIVWDDRPDGSIRRTTHDRPNAPPWQRDQWLTHELTIITRAEDAGWTVSTWTDARGSEVRRTRVEEGHLVELDDGVLRTCTFDAEGRPTHTSDGVFETSWHYQDGRLASVERGGRVSPVEVAADGTLSIDGRHYQGDCSEVVFWECSAVLRASMALPLRPGLLPTAP